MYGLGMFLLTYYTYNGFVASTRVTVQYGTPPSLQHHQNPSITTTVFKGWGRGFVDFFSKLYSEDPYLVPLESILKFYN